MRGAPPVSVSRSGTSGVVLRKAKGSPGLTVRVLTGRALGAYTSRASFRLGSRAIVLRLPKGRVAAISVSRGGYWPVRAFAGPAGVGALPSRYLLRESRARLWRDPEREVSRRVGGNANMMVVPEASTVNSRGELMLRVRAGGRAAWILDSEVLPANRPLGSGALAGIRGRLGGRKLGNVGAMIIDHVTGQSLYEKNPDRRRILASVTKVFTVAAAAKRGILGPGLAARILLPSDNWLADRLAARIGGGSLRRGARRAAALARAMGSKVSLADGSGLSRADRASAWEVTNLLLAIRADPRLRRVESAMPLAGVSGTLSGRMRGTAAARRCRAKTGTLHDVSTLAGFCLASSGRTLRFALLMNNTSVYSARAAQDATLARMVAGG